MENIQNLQNLYSSSGSGKKFPLESSFPGKKIVTIDGNVSSFEEFSKAFMDAESNSVVVIDDFDIFCKRHEATKS